MTRSLPLTVPGSYKCGVQLRNLSHKVARGTVSNVLKRNGIEPAPERSKRTTWSTFLKAHWRILAASDFSLWKYGRRGDC